MVSWLREMLPSSMGAGSHQQYSLGKWRLGAGKARLEHSLLGGRHCKRPVQCCPSSRTMHGSRRRLSWSRTEMCHSRRKRGWKCLKGMERRPEASRARGQTWIHSQHCWQDGHLREEMPLLRCNSGLWSHQPSRMTGKYLLEQRSRALE